MIDHVKSLAGIKKAAQNFRASINIPGDNLFYQRSTEGGGRAMFETKLQGVTAEDIFIFHMFDNFTEGRSERNWSIILAT